MPTQAQALIELIAHTRTQLDADPARATRFRALQYWQLERLQRTYDDFLRRASHRGALQFFMHDLYGPHDFSQRDRDLKRVIDVWLRVLPERAIRAVTSALELEALSLSLDLDVVDALGETALNEASYARAYRTAGRRADRELQIALIIAAGESLQHLVGNPWISRAVRLARTPARLAGFAALHDFLERGYRAFDRMGDAAELLREIQRRELAIMHNLFAGAPHPFDMEERRRAS